MSNAFEVVMATSVSDALEAKGQASRWFAGGTDLIPEIKVTWPRQAAWSI
jgi:CO/xanthine dehydrogenase FAD-binding subunit